MQPGSYDQPDPIHHDSVLVGAVIPSTVCDEYANDAPCALPPSDGGVAIG
jgi:hypothetical protein